MRGLLLATVLAALALAGCIGLAGQGTGPGPVDDASGPAIEPRTVQIAEDTAGDTGPYVGTGTGPGALDLVGLSFTETPTTLRVTHEVAELPDEQAFEEAVREGETGWAAWAASWAREADGPNDEALFLLVENSAEGLVFQTQNNFYSTTCNDWGWCSERVPYEIEYGTPGRIHVDIPRAHLWNGTGAQGETLHDVRAWTFNAGEPVSRTTVSWDIGGPVGWSGGLGVFAPGTTYDSASGDEPFTLRTPRAPDDATRRSRDRFDETIHYSGGSKEAETVHILDVRVVETPQNLTVANRVARVEATPSDHSFYAVLGMPNGRVHQAGYTADEQGNVEPWAGACSDENCTRWIGHPVDIEVVPGTPGWVNATFDREDLGEPEAGQRITLLSTQLYTDRETQGVGEVRLDDGIASVTATPGADWTWSGNAPAYWFADDTAVPGPSPSTGLVLEDAVGDADTPASSSDQARYDVTHVEVQAETEDILAVELGVADLSEVKEVPPTYSAAFYTVALQTDAGPFMAGFYTDGDRQEFLCAQDTGILDASYSDPTSVIWTTIPGRVSVGSGVDDPNAPSGSGTTGALLLDVPHECLGVEPGDVTIQRLAGASILVRRAADEDVTVFPTDRVDRDEPYTAAAPSPPAEPTAASAWYVAPFGVEGFWDIAGILAAVAFSAAGVLVVQRRRQALRDYLDEIERIQRDEDPRSREQALLTLRDEVRDDFAENRVSENQLVVVEDRIDEALSDARIDSLGAVFGDLPHRLVVRLEKLLSDGTLSAEDHRIVSAIVEDADLPDDAKEDVLAELDAWMARDA